MTEIWALAALWLGLALLATLLSIWLRIATALSEIVVGTIAQLVIGAIIGAAVLGTDQTWVKFLSGAGAILLTFLAGGSFVSVPALIAAPAAFLIMLVTKLISKIAGVYPVTRYFGSPRKEGMYTTLLMSTGLTFGTRSYMA